MKGDAEIANEKRLTEIVQYFEKSVAFAELVGERVKKIEAGRAILYLDVEGAHLNGNDTLHGGVHATLIDSAMSLSLIALTESRIATTQMNIHFLGPAREGRIICHGEVIHRTSRTATTRGNVYDNTGNLVATGTGSFKVFEQEDAPTM